MHRLYVQNSIESKNFVIKIVATFAQDETSFASAYAGDFGCLIKIILISFFTSP